MRIFKDGDSFSAVVSLYNKKGDLLTGIFSEKGLSLSPKVEKLEKGLEKGLEEKSTVNKEVVVSPKTETESIKKEENSSTSLNKLDKKEEKKEKKMLQDEKTRNVINNLRKDKVKSFEEKVNEFEENYLAFEEVTLIDIQSKKVISNWTNPILGKYEKSLTWSEFYHKSGRKDLAKKYDDMRTRAWIFMGISIGSFATTFLFINTGEDVYSQSEINKAPEGSSRRDEMKDANRDSNNVIPEVKPLGWVFIGAGLASLITSAIMFRYQPVEIHELRKIADIHNKKLRRDLGLTNDSKSEEISFDYSITPYADKNSGGLVLDVKF